MLHACISDLGRANCIIAVSGWGLAWQTKEPIAKATMIRATIGAAIISGDNRRGDDSGDNRCGDDSGGFETRPYGTVRYHNSIMKRDYSDGVWRN